MGEVMQEPQRLPDSPPGEVLSATPDEDLLAKPLSASTPEEFVRELNKFRICRDMPSLRTIANRGRPQVSFVAVGNALKSQNLPSIRVLRAIVTGCSDSEEDLNDFVTAWRRLQIASRDDTSAR